MSTALPMIISEYLSAADRGDVDAMVACFIEDAVVVDEDEEHCGHAAIRRWRETVATAYEYTVEVRGSDAPDAVDGLERYDVFTHLEGNFPGGAVDLTHRFGLRDGRIARMEIVPTEATS